MGTAFRLYWEFFKTGLFSVGGGLATLPFLIEMSARTGWFTSADIADMVAISESTPGPLGINMGTYVGYKTIGLFGGVVATLGIITPAIVIIILISNKVFKVRVSGHACSVSGPLVYSGFFLGVWGIVVGVVCWGLILWASLAMKRHTVKEFLLGTLTCLLSFTVGWLIFH